MNLKFFNLIFFLILLMQVNGQTKNNFHQQLHDKSRDLLVYNDYKKALSFFFENEWDSVLVYTAKQIELIDNPNHVNIALF